MTVLGPFVPRRQLPPWINQVSDADGDEGCSGGGPRDGWTVTNVVVLDGVAFTYFNAPGMRGLMTKREIRALVRR